MINNVIIESDDFHPDPSVDCLYIAQRLIQKYPKIVLNFFTPACYNQVPLYTNKDWCDEVRLLIDSGNIRLGVHSLYHTQEEFKYYNYRTAVDKIKLAEDIFRVAKLPFLKVFRGSHWGICEDSIKALIDLGYTHLYSHINYKELNDKYSDKIKIIYYNFNLADTWPNMENPTESDICVMHSHTHAVCNNGIGESYNKLCEIIDNNNFTYLSIDSI